MLHAINPMTGASLTRRPWMTSAEREALLASAFRCARSWRESPLSRRVEALQRLAEVLESAREELATTMVDEMGKPIVQARAEVEKCAWVCRHYAEHGPAWLADEAVAADGSAAWVRHDPLGVILAIMPWNFPLWQYFRFAAPALLAGNVPLLKHAPNVPGCAQAIERIGERAGLVEGLMSALHADIAEVEETIRDPRIAGVTLTGSERAGRAVAAVAGAALKPLVLELGGADPFIVLEDADLEQAIEIAVRSRTQNNGQSCIAAKRFIVVAERHDAFVEGLTARMASLRVGDPRDPATEVGPLVHADAVRTLGGQVDRSLAAGARRVCGAPPPPGPPWFFPPTVLTGVRPGMPAFDEELFGPVASVTVARDDADAVALAEHSRYGLGATVFASESRALALVAKLTVGHVAVNGMVKSDPRLPFGGTGASGYGRELGRDGLLAFVNRKTVWVA